MGLALTRHYSIALQNFAACPIKCGKAAPLPAISHPLSLALEFFPFPPSLRYH
jgi:hypothetical protein